MKPLDGRVAWVTGGASGIGRATVRKLRGMGATVAILDLVDRSAPDNEVQHCDISSLQSVEEAADALERRLGRPDILVNSAGIAGGAPLVDFPTELWDRIIAVNLTGSFHVVRRVLGGMMERRWGRIILVSSDAAFRAAPGQAAYASTKAGVIALAQVTAMEGGPAGVTCNVISPGIVDTPMTRRRWSSRDALESAVNSEGTRNPLGAVLDADDLAHAAAFLCHPDSGHITGQTLHVNGGMIMR